MNILRILLIGFLSACQSESYESYRAKGREKTELLVDTLKSIRTKDQLIDRHSELQDNFGELARLYSRIKEYQLRHSEKDLPPLSLQDLELSDQLRVEILRVCRLEGGREIIDKCRTLPQL